MGCTVIDIDEEKTVSNTREFLEFELPQLASLADRDVTSLSSPQLSFSCSHSAPQSQDDLLINHWSADTALVAIHAAAHHIPAYNDERQIFINIYFRHMTEKELVNKMLISKSTLRRKKRKALIEFAVRLDTQKRNPNHNCDWLASLVVNNNRKGESFLDPK